MRSPSMDYLNYFMYMFWICLLGVFTSGLQILACFVGCCPGLSCFGKIAVWTSFCVQIGSIIMLYLGSVWRFSLDGRSCATNVGRARDSWLEDGIATGSKAGTDFVNKKVNEKIDEAKESAGLGDEDKKKVEKVAEAFKPWVWGETAMVMKALLYWQYFTMTLLCLACILTCGSVPVKVNAWNT